ncbi:DUF4383 domain-containing protein [Streptomyces sp. NPDC008313]|uniref:DUF4383 domain-containing protein n=1 Tax=Streptomyces sp. NPDC008313 TaxID=3364826 RepID=UPI0036EA6B47
MRRQERPGAEGQRPVPPVLSRAVTLVGALFVVAGLLGFVPGITTRYGRMGFAGPHAGARLFGLFAVSALHNLVHLAFGLAGLYVGLRAPRWCRTYLVVGGFAYLALWVYGLCVHRGTEWNFLSVNGADNWLHLGLGFGMVALGTLLAPRKEPGQ